MDRILLAFAKYGRQNFLPDEIKNLAHHDWALPIGHDQTNSQPTTVKLMLHWLDPQPGDKILDVGSGSGWTTALLSHIVGSKGEVYGIERVLELVEFGQDNIERAGVKNARILPASGKLGLPDGAPFDRILVSAAAVKLPQELIDQLKIGGKMVIPIQNDVLEITKTSKNKFDKVIHSGFAFVPLL